MSKDKTDDDIAFIRALAEILNDNDLGEIEVSREFGEDDELSVRLARAGSAPAPVYAPAPTSAPAPLPIAATGHAETAAATEAPVSNKDVVPSPMVGTVYLAPEPDAAVFVSVGDTVTKGQTILIIEAMKTMNQIPSPRSGTVQAIMVEDSEPVEYGSPLMTIV